MSTSTTRKARLIPTRVPETLAWIRLDLLARLVPFAFVVTLVYRVWRPAWLGFSPGNLGAQLRFGLLGGALLFVAATVVQLVLPRRRRALLVPADTSDLLLQTGFYLSLIHI